MSQSLSSCSHANVAWEPLAIEYNFDGTAEVSQIGACAQCGVRCKLNYEPGDRVLVTGTS
jgi:hypothetical protein